MPSLRQIGIALKAVVNTQPGREDAPASEVPNGLGSDLKKRRAVKGTKKGKVPSRQKLAKMAAKSAKAARVGRVAAADAQLGGLRLNLGCGDKLLRGYVNIDVAPSRKGIQPDILCDVRSLSLRDGCADEALSVHVVEHFYHWEAKDLLEEWKRVLKPGGRIVVECPNLITAARELLEDPDTRSQPGKDGQMSMWVFYGDPQWQDPLMCHKWGYTPDGLKRLLEEVGFVEVRQEPAQFKKKDPRDMRVTGRKPVE